MKQLRRPSEGWKKSSGVACPEELRVQLCQRKTRRPTLRDWRLISAFALLVIVLSTSFSAATTSTNASSEMRRGDPRSVRIPAIDGDDIRFSRLSTAQGLSQTQANQIVQDDQGFIWFGTQYGLDRYDGYEFKVFTHDPAHANSLSCVISTRYLRIVRDRFGWAAISFWTGLTVFTKLSLTIVSTPAKLRTMSARSVRIGPGCFGWQQEVACFG